MIISGLVYLAQEAKRRPIKAQYWLERVAQCGEGAAYIAFRMNLDLFCENYDPSPSRDSESGSSPTLGGLVIY